MNLIILDSFNIGGIEKRYLSLIEFLINTKKDTDFEFFINRSCIKNSKTFSLFKKKTNVKIYGINSFFSRIPYLRYFEYRLQLFLSFNNFIWLINKSYKNTFFIGINSLRFINKVKTDNRIYELVYSGEINDQKEFSDVFNKTTNFSMSFLCLTESIYQKAIKLLDKNINPNSSIIFSNKSFFSPQFNHEDSNEIKKNKSVSFVSRLDYGKGVDLLIEIINSTLQINRNIEFLIVGYGKLENYLNESLIKINKKYSTDLKIIKSTQVSELLRRSIIFLSLQENENFPSQSALEAMYYENYILATDVGMSSLLVKNNNGIVLPSISDVFVKQIVSLIQDFDNTKIKGKKSKELIVQEYNVNSYWEFLNQSYNIL